MRVCKVYGIIIGNRNNYDLSRSFFFFLGGGGLVVLYLYYITRSMYTGIYMGSICGGDWLVVIPSNSLCHHIIRAQC